MPKQIMLPLLAISLLLALSGCVDSLSPEQRFYCLDLTEKSYAFVPECSNEKECFSKIESEFFSFDQSVFSSEVRSRLYTYKNNASLSWLYFNKARKNISEIHNICNTNKNITGLIFQLNELTHNISKAFEFSNLANKESFAILLLEFEDLKQEEIRLAKEEPLFNDLALLSLNLSQLSNPKTCQSNESYSCFYLRQTESFTVLTSSTGFDQSIVSESNIFSILNQPSSYLAKYLNTEFKIPFIDPLLPNFVSYLANLFTKENAISNLEKIPAFQFLQIYNNFMGTGNTCLTKFSDLIEQNALHRKQLIQRNAELEVSAIQGIKEAEAGINSLLSENYAGFDSEFFQKLYSGLDQKSTVSSQKYSIRDFGELRKKSNAKLSELKQELVLLQQQDSLNNLSLGKKAESLKELNAEIAFLKENSEYLKNEVLGGLLVLCNERADFIKQELEQASLPLDYISTASDLKARAKFKLALFKQAKDQEQKLFQCNEMVNEFSRFSLALQNFEEYQLLEETELEDCLSFLNKSLESSKSSGISFDDFTLRFLNLKNIEQPYTDIESVKRICTSLETDLREFLQNQSSITKIEEQFSQAKQMLLAIEIAESKDLVSKTKMKNIDSQKAYFEDFFSNQKLIFEKALPLLPDLGQSLSEFISLLEETLTVAIHSFVEENASIIETDKSIEIELDNTFPYATKGPLTMHIPFDKNSETIIAFSPNILSFKTDGKTISLDLNGLPQGKTILCFSKSVENSFVPEQINILQTIDTNTLFPVSIPSSNSVQQIQDIAETIKISEKIDSLQFFISSADETLVLLDTIFSNISDEEIISSKYILPITREEFDKLRLNINSLKSFFGKKQLQDFQQLVVEGDIDNALKKSGQFSEQLNVKLLEAEQISSRLSNAFSQIKEDAVVSFNSAAEIFNTNPDNPDAKKRLENAEKLLLNGSYLESITESKNATALLSLPPTATGLNLPILAIPIAACAGLVLFVRFKKEKDGKQKEELVKKIESNW